MTIIRRRRLNRWARRKRDAFIMAAVLASCTGPTMAQDPSSSPRFAEPAAYAVTGVSVYDVATLIDFARSHVGRHDETITPARLAEAIELIYREDGYLLVDVEDWSQGEGQPHLIVVNEGRISEIAIEGVETGTFERIRAHFEPVLAADPLRSEVLERALMLSDDMSGVAVTTEIEIAPDGSGAKLRVLGEPVPATGSLTIDNWPHEADPVASIYLDQEFFSVLTANDRLRLDLGATHFFEDVDEDFSLFGTVGYRLPVGGDGAFVEAIAGNSYAERSATGGFTASDLRGLTVAAAAGYPVIRDIHQFGYGLVEARYSQSNADTVGFTSDSAVVAGGLASAYGLVFDNDGSMDLTLTATVGARVDDDDGADEGDDAFWHLRLGAGLVEPLDFIDAHTALSATIAAQATTSDLPAVETFYLGDRYLLRGYDFAEASGDLGIAGSIEVSRLFRLDGPVQSIAPHLFLDAGHARLVEDQAGRADSETLASSGVGATVQIADRVLLSGWVAVPLTDGPRTEAGDASLYLSLSYTW